VLEKFPEADSGKVSLKDNVITVLLAFFAGVVSAIFVLVPFFFVTGEKSTSVIMNALLLEFSYYS
jgi:VIT1/CCC1 family predicted Fe2+/Mn2+ transporter